MMQDRCVTLAATAVKKPGRLWADDLQRRNEELLAIAEATLVERGYEGTTLNSIAESPSVSQRTISGSRPATEADVTVHIVGDTSGNRIVRRGLR